MPWLNESPLGVDGPRQCLMHQIGPGAQGHSSALSHDNSEDCAGRAVAPLDLVRTATPRRGLAGRAVAARTSHACTLKRPGWMFHLKHPPRKLSPSPCTLLSIYSPAAHPFAHCPHRLPTVLNRRPTAAQLMSSPAHLLARVRAEPRAPTPVPTAPYPCPQPHTRGPHQPLSLLRGAFY